MILTSAIVGMPELKYSFRIYFAKVLVEKVSLENLRLYIAADNLFEFSNVKDGFDPESKVATGQGNVDVYARTVSFGIDLTF